MKILLKELLKIKRRRKNRNHLRKKRMLRPKLLMKLKETRSKNSRSQPRFKVRQLLICKTLKASTEMRNKLLMLTIQINLKTPNQL